jgi:hypothetical protein
MFGCFFSLVTTRFLFILSYYKSELEKERDPNRRQSLLQQISTAEAEVLSLLRAEREHLERVNLNLEEALARIRKHRRH